MSAWIVELLFEIFLWAGLLAVLTCVFDAGELWMLPFELLALALVLLRRVVRWLIGGWELRSPRVDPHQQLEHAAATALREIQADALRTMTAMEEYAARHGAPKR